MRAQRWIGAVAGIAAALGAYGNAGQAHAATLKVCSSGCPYAQIQPAIHAASNGDTIDIGAGVYDGSLTIPKSVTLVGQGETNTFIVNGNPVVTVAAGSTVSMNGLTVEGGSGPSSVGGIQNFGALTLLHVTVRNNQGGVGGIASQSGSSLALANVTLEGNVGNTGGALFVDSGATLSGSDITIDSNSGGTGGGVYAFGTVTLTRASISRNIASWQGGGIFNAGALTLIDSAVTGNTAGLPTHQGIGGGIFNLDSGTVTRTNSPVKDNVPDNCYNCTPPAPGPKPLPVRATPFVLGGTPAMSAFFVVAFRSRTPGQGYVLFGPGPGCAGLVELATRDTGAGTNQHVVTVAGDEMKPMSGAVLPGVTYSYAVETVTKAGVELDNNGGTCYTVTIPSSVTV